MKIKLSENLIAYLMKQLLECLYCLHEEIGLAHLDLKPENIVLTDDYKLAFIDFGCSVSKNIVATSIVGTKSYMAPELRAHMKNP